MRIPSKEGGFESKDSEGREIPLSAEFVDFLRKYLSVATPNSFILRSRKNRKSKNETYDFRKPVSDYMAGVGHHEFYPHSMRHSWITELVNSGNHTLQEVSAWSGDNLETIERNYWKKRVVAGSIDATLRGERTQVKQAQQLDEVVAKLGELLTASHGPKQARAIQKLSELMRRHDIDLEGLLAPKDRERPEAPEELRKAAWTRFKEKVSLTTDDDKSSKFAHVL